MTEAVTWNELMRTARTQLSAAGLPSPDADIRLLTEWVAGKIPLGHEAASAEQSAQFTAAISRRLRNEPIQHISGTMWFRYLELVSAPGVFIVRPETEMVAQAGIDFLARSQGNHPVVVDLCTGSGAIALSIATEVPRAKVWAVERDQVAYEYACQNNERYGNPVQLVHGDAREVLSELAGQVDVVISNPPYVPQTAQLPADVSYDPPVALYGGGADGLDLPRQLIQRAEQLLAPGGVLIMEHGDDQGSAMRQAAADAQFVNIHTGRDLTGRDRWLYAEKGVK